MHSQALTTIPEESWEPHFLEEAHTLYIEEALWDVAALAALNNDTQAVPAKPPLQPDDVAIDPMGSLQLPPSSSPSLSPPDTPPECNQANLVLGVDSTLPAWQEDTHPPPGIPRAVKKLLHSE